MSVISWIANLIRSRGSSGRRNRRRVVSVGELEPRILLTVSATEQLYLELINRARANPTAEASRFQVNLNEGLAAGTISTAAKQPLALNDLLQKAIQGHLKDMIGRDFFSHIGSNGSTYIKRIEAAGYKNWTAASENLGYRVSSSALNTEAMVLQLHKELFIDKGITGRGHRVNLLNASYKEVGAGVSTGDYKGANSVFVGNDFAARAGNSLLTGVVYTDAKVTDKFYSIGEGLAGVSVVVRDGTRTVASTTSNAAGGYQVQVPPGKYTVTFSGKGFTHSVSKSFTIGPLNVKVDANTRTDVVALPTVSFSAGTYTVSESGVSKIITVSLSRAATTPVLVGYTTSNGTAIARQDYTLTSGTLLFAPGERTKTFTIPIINDTTVESTETVNMTLSAPTGLTLGTLKTATLSITDNDAASTVRSFDQSDLGLLSPLSRPRVNVRY